LAPRTDDADHMRAALALARRGLGRTYPNPAVGCVLTNPEGYVVGRGWTQPSGRPHAETEALRRAGGAARGGTAYVTLEPCCHVGQTPPCSQALIDAGIARVVVATNDPDPRVSGGGLKALRQAGIAVETGLLEAEAREINAGFFLRTEAGRPMVTLKLATSLDGRIATASGQSQWITGEESRARAHLLRAAHDAILVGRGTVEADNPSLTCRLPGCADRSPLRVVLDSKLSLFKDGGVPHLKIHPAWVICGKDIENCTPALNGWEMIPVELGKDGRVDPFAALQALAVLKGVTRVLVEGGGEVAGSFLRGNLVDRVVWFRAPVVIGGDGRPALGGLGVETLAQALRFRVQSREVLGQDVVETYVREAGS